MRPVRRAWLSVDRLIAPQMPAQRLGAFRFLVCLLALYDLLLYTPLVLSDAAAVAEGTQVRTWRPIYLFQLLQVSPIDLDTANVLWTISVVALLCAALGFCSRLACAVGAVCFFFWSGLAYSFGKPHHDKVALAFTMAALPFARVGAAFALDSLLWRKRWPRTDHSSRSVKAMPIRLAQITLAIGYAGAGWAKVLLGGVDWFNGYTLQGIMLGHDGYLSRIVGESPTLCQLQSIGVVAVQAFFPIVLFWPRARWFFLPMAVFFHLMTWMTMDTGAYMRVWWMLWAFVALEQIPDRLLDWLGGSRWTAWFCGLSVTAMVMLVGYIASDAQYVPMWSLFAIGGFLLLWLLRYAARRRLAGC